MSVTKRAVPTYLLSFLFETQRQRNRWSLAGLCGLPSHKNKLRDHFYLTLNVGGRLKEKGHRKDPNSQCFAADL